MAQQKQKYDPVEVLVVFQPDALKNAARLGTLVHGLNRIPISGRRRYYHPDGTFVNIWQSEKSFKASEAPKININGENYAISFQATSHHPSFIQTFNVFSKGVYLSMDPTYGAYIKQLYIFTRSGQPFRYVIVVDTIMRRDLNQKYDTYDEPQHRPPPVIQTIKIDK